jgi:hypothetical protein
MPTVSNKIAGEIVFSIFYFTNYVLQVNYSEILLRS